MRAASRFSVVCILSGLASPLLAQERPVFEILVERILLDAYVTDTTGEPLDDLRPSNFVVTIDGERAEVETVEFIDMTRPREIDEELVHPDSDLATIRGRLLVYFFQTDIQRHSSRVPGHMAMIHEAVEFLKTLQPEDRVAVVQFDSHLKMRQDFTTDREKIETAIRSTLRMEEPPRPEPVPSPALMTRLDPDEMKKAASAEKGLFLLGNALIPVPGPKSLILFGYGLGRFGSSGVRMTSDYVIARRALEKSRTSVFSLDVSRADFHSLEVGLKQASKDTGGFYAKTHNFPKFAMSRLERTLSARYEIVVKRPPDLPRGIHEVEIRIVGRKQEVEVLARETWEDEYR